MTAATLTCLCTTTYGGELLLYDERRCKVENLDKSVHVMNSMNFSGRFCVQKFQLLNNA